MILMGNPHIFVRDAELERLSSRGTLGRVNTPFLLRSDNGLVERVIRTIKEQCVHRHRFETLQYASRVISDWIGFYNQKRPHQALKMKTPSQVFEMFKLSA
jgi:putative transposase